MASEYEHVVERVKASLQGDGWHNVDMNIVHDIARWLKSTRNQHRFTPIEVATAYDLLTWKAQEDAART